MSFTLEIFKESVSIEIGHETIIEFPGNLVCSILLHQDKQIFLLDIELYSGDDDDVGIFGLEIQKGYSLKIVLEAEAIEGSLIPSRVKAGSQRDCEVKLKFCDDQYAFIPARLIWSQFIHSKGYGIAISTVNDNNNYFQKYLVDVIWKPLGLVTSTPGSPVFIVPVLSKNGSKNGALFALGVDMDAAHNSGIQNKHADLIHEYLAPLKKGARLVQKLYLDSGSISLEDGELIILKHLFSVQDGLLFLHQDMFDVEADPRNVAAQFGSQLILADGNLEVTHNLNNKKSSKIAWVEHESESGCMAILPALRDEHGLPLTVTAPRFPLVLRNGINYQKNYNTPPSQLYLSFKTLVLGSQNEPDGITGNLRSLDPEYVDMLSATPAMKKDGVRMSWLREACRVARLTSAPSEISGFAGNCLLERSKAKTNESGLTVSIKCNPFKAKLESMLYYTFPTLQFSNRAGDWKLRLQRAESEYGTSDSLKRKTDAVTYRDFTSPANEPGKDLNFQIPAFDYHLAMTNMASQYFNSNEILDESKLITGEFVKKLQSWNTEFLGVFTQEPKAEMQSLHQAGFSYYPNLNKPKPLAGEPHPVIKAIFSPPPGRSSAASVSFREKIYTKIFTDQKPSSAALAITRRQPPIMHEHSPTLVFGVNEKKDRDKNSAIELRNELKKTSVVLSPEELDSGESIISSGQLFLLFTQLWNRPSAADKEGIKDQIKLLELPRLTGRFTNLQQGIKSAV